MGISAQDNQYHELAINTARKAGVILREEFNRQGEPRGKHGHTEADKTAELLIFQALKSIFRITDSWERKPAGSVLMVILTIYGSSILMTVQVLTLKASGVCPYPSRCSKAMNPYWA